MRQARPPPVPGGHDFGDPRPHRPTGVPRTETARRGPFRDGHVKAAATPSPLVSMRLGSGTSLHRVSAAAGPFRACKRARRRATPRRSQRTSSMGDRRPARDASFAGRMRKSSRTSAPDDRADLLSRHAAHLVRIAEPRAPRGRQGSAGDHAVIDIITPAPKPGRAEERGRPKCGQLSSASDPKAWPASAIRSFRAATAAPASVKGRVKPSCRRALPGH